MRTARCSGLLSCQARPLPHMPPPPAMHALHYGCPLATLPAMHTSHNACHPGHAHPPCHACHPCHTPLPCMPPTMHTPCYTCPPVMHAPHHPPPHLPYMSLLPLTRPAMHAPVIHASNHTCPPHHTGPPLPCSPPPRRPLPCMPPVNRMTDKTGVKTLPCRNFVAGGNKVTNLSNIFRITLEVRTKIK